VTVHAADAQGAAMIKRAPSRRTVMAGAAALAATPLLAQRGSAFSWEGLKTRALALAARPYVAPPRPPRGLDAVSYDVLNHVSFKAEAALWPGTPQEVRFFPQSVGAKEPVAISVVENGRERALPFSRDLFTGGDRLPVSANGFSGFRVMSPGGKSDWLAFQGASYFRSAGSLDQYGLSARAVAIDCGLSTPEEFPRFTHFWLERGSDSAIIVYALLDSPRAAGAWRFVNRIGVDGVTQDVSMVLALRGDIARLGLTPLTSMFWYGEGDRAQAADWRPEIHDSDGLAMATGAGERLWRPLRNPAQVATNSFADRDPGGFGLLQRDRVFDHYQDDGVFYDRRPNLWVEPVAPFGPGNVMLVEIPTHAETMDNVVAFWTPAAPARAGQRFALDYRLRWNAAEPPGGTARAIEVFRGAAQRPGFEPIPGAGRLVVDFDRDSLRGLSRTSGVTAKVTATRGRLLAHHAYPVVGHDGRWRLVMDIARDGGEPVDVRAYLSLADGALTETLLYPF
jgi:periplasmic glucans biosynthesis protein